MLETANSEKNGECHHTMSNLPSVNVVMAFERGAETKGPAETYISIWTEENKLRQQVFAA